MRGATGAFAGLSITCPLASFLLWSASGCRRGLSCVRSVKSTRNHVIMYVSDGASTSIRYTNSVVQSMASLGGDTVDLVMLIDMANSFLAVRAVGDEAGSPPYNPASFVAPALGNCPQHAVRSPSFRNRLACTFLNSLFLRQPRL